jgi:hypothetical protein
MRARISYAALGEGKWWWWYDPGESGAMWVITLVHWCLFVVCAGRSARLKSCGRRLRLPDTLVHVKIEGKCCQIALGAGIWSVMDVGREGHTGHAGVCVVITYICC